MLEPVFVELAIKGGRHIATKGKKKTYSKSSKPMGKNKDCVAEDNYDYLL